MAVLGKSVDFGVAEKPVDVHSVDLLLQLDEVDLERGDEVYLVDRKVHEGHVPWSRWIASFHLRPAHLPLRPGLGWRLLVHEPCTSLPEVCGCSVSAMRD